MGKSYRKIPSLNDKFLDLRKKKWIVFFNKKNFWKEFREITVLETDTGRQLKINKAYEITMVKELGKIPL